MREDLGRIAFGDRTAYPGQDELFSMLRSSSLTRDENAPVSVSPEDKQAWESRKDISEARAQIKAETNSRLRNLLSHKIARIMHNLTKLRILELRKEYFSEVDKRRGLGLPTDDLHVPASIAEVPASRVGHFLGRSTELKQLSELRRTRQFITLLVDFYHNKMSSCSDDLRFNAASDPDLPYLPSSNVMKTDPDAVQQPAHPLCLLCGDTFLNRSGLTRHHERRHLRDAFQTPFPCPECLRDGREGGLVIESTAAWSSHVEMYHGRQNAPKPVKARMIWHYSIVVGETAYCMLCGKDGFHAANGFSRHVSRIHKQRGDFTKPISCRGCCQLIDAGHEAWVEHMWKVHQAWPTNGAILHKVGDPSPISTQSKKRARSEDKHSDRASASASDSDNGHDSDSDALSEWSDNQIDSLLSSLEPSEEPEMPAEPEVQLTPRRKRARLEFDSKGPDQKFSRTRFRSPSPLDSITCLLPNTDIAIDPALWETVPRPSCTP